MRSFVINGIFTSLFLLSTTVYADIVTVEPDDFADGTDISNSFPGVTLSFADGSAVFATPVTSTTPSTGTRGFGNSPTNDLLAGFNTTTPDPFSVAGLSPSSQVLRVDFATPTNFVSIDVIPDDSNDPSRLAAYDAAGNLLDTDGDPGVGVADIPVTLSITRPSADIAFILASGINGDNVALDNLQYDGNIAAVPTLSEWALILLMMSLGAIGIQLTRKQSMK